MTSSTSPEQQELLAEITEAEKQLKELRAELGTVNDSLQSLEGERQQYQLVDEICTSLQQLNELGAAKLFWGDDLDEASTEQQLERARSNIREFQHKIAEIDESKQKLDQGVERQELRIENLHEELIRQQEQEERARYDFTIERDERVLPFREMVMPWSKRGEDEKRFRKTLALVLLFTITFGSLISFYELPEPDINEPVEIPEHLVKLIKKEKPKPKPKPKPKEEKKEEKKQDKAKDKPKPTPAETKVAREKAKSSGVLAFSDSFNDLLQDDVDAKLGASAKLTNKGAKASGDSSRSLVMSQAASSSGGIQASSISRGIGGTAGSRMGDGVGFSRVETSIGTEGMDEALSSDNATPSRSDQEIQIVFDRYKGALYRIYNKELRKDPTLMGKMILRLTIEPDGSVSMAKVVSSDLDSAELSKQIIARVKRFNFGPKEGVPKITIDYPIDFLPAS